MAIVSPPPPDHATHPTTPLFPVPVPTLSTPLRNRNWEPTSNNVTAGASKSVSTLSAEIDQLKAEHAKARSDQKAKLQAQIDQLRARLEKRLEQNQARSKQAAEQLQAKVAALQKKAAQEKGDAKAAIEARITRLRDDYQSRQHV